MDNLPDLRTNLGTWAVNNHDLPALGKVLTDLYSAESFDPDFRGQDLETTYFDTPGFDLWKARQKGDRYLTLRLRCYASPGQSDFYALSVKTEDQKFRLPIPDEVADILLLTQNAHP